MTQLRSRRGFTWGACLLLGQATASLAQGFSSGSNESDGALNVAGSQGTIAFNPTALGIDADGDRVFHFSTITVGAGTILRFPASTLGEGRPIVWLASGPVTIEGTLDLSGSPGHPSTGLAVPADAGAGGFMGGPGATTGSRGRAGSGPGGGASEPGLSGGHAGHLFTGTTSSGRSTPGAPYGNAFLLPLLGGSGGGGTNPSTGTQGGGGGGGGGAILIASSSSIVVSGAIRANGGAGQGSGAGGHGSGGAIRLITPALGGNGSLNVQSNVNNPTSSGRIRLETFSQGFSGLIEPLNAVTVAGPGLVFLPADAPKVRVTAVGGVAVTPTPTGSFVTPDVVINSSTPVSIDIAAENIPPGTQVRITLIPENGSSVTFTSTALTGSLASSTATAGPVTIPNGFTRFFVAATWAP